MNNEPDDFEDFVDQPEDKSYWSRGDDMSMWDTEDDDLTTDFDNTLMDGLEEEDEWSINEIPNNIEDYDYSAQDAVDWDKQVAMVEYCARLVEIVNGRDEDSLKIYREDNGEEAAILYWFFDNLNHEVLDNEYLAEDMQEVLDKWVVGDYTHPVGLQKLKEVMDDYGLDGAC